MTRKEAQELIADYNTEGTCPDRDTMLDIYGALHDDDLDEQELHEAGYCDLWSYLKDR